MRVLRNTSHAPSPSPMGRGFRKFAKYKYVHVADFIHDYRRIA